MKRRLFFALVLSLATLPLLVFNTASAAKPGAGGSKTPLGIDVSWPQCGRTLPKDHAFAIVGVNGGLANTTNPCLTDQLIWATQAIGGTQQEKIQLYVNTANPGGLNTVSWPRSDVDVAGNTPTNPYGSCDGSDSLDCAWLYGWNRALEDIRDRFAPAVAQTDLGPSPSPYIRWLDVETENTWKLGETEFDYKSNVAVLEGMTAYFNYANVRVGLYSTDYQWGQIVGNQVSTSSNLNGLPNWRPGGANLSTAKQACTAAPLTPGGTVVLTQFVWKNLDRNYSCIG